MRLPLLAVAVAFASIAVAGEKQFGTEAAPLGEVLATDGGSANNQYTGTGTNTFVIGQNTKLTVWCREDSLVCVGTPTCTAAGNGEPIPAFKPFTTSCGELPIRYTLIDAGTYNNLCLVSNAPNVSDAGVWSRCYWKTRRGDEGP